MEHSSKSSLSDLLNLEQKQYIQLQPARYNGPGFDAADVMYNCHQSAPYGNLAVVESP